MEQVPVVESKGLFQVERVIDTYIAPSKTFTDILRSTAWWLPFLIFCIVSAGFAYAIDKKITFEAVTEQAIQQSQATQDQLATLSPSEKALRIHQRVVGTKYVVYASGIFFLLISLVAALLNWATINFGFGAKTTFGQNYAVQMYAALPLAIKSLLATVLIFAGVGTENFNINNPVGTSIGYYMTDSPVWMRTLLTYFDLFSFWTMALSIIGLAIISRKSVGQAAAVVIGWWLVTVAIFTGLAAAFS